MRSILATLSDRERDGLHRFYDLGHEEAIISRDLNFKQGEFNDLRARVRKQFGGAKMSFSQHSGG